MSSKALKLALPLALILLLAAALRFYCLGCQSLWSDEGNSVALAAASFAEIAQRTAFDIHPPLYYWLLKIWVAIFGSGEVALRSLSAVLGVGVVWLTWEIARRLFAPGVAHMAALIAALSPLLVYYSQETRMYMLLTFLSGCTVLLTIVIGGWSLASGQQSVDGPKFSAFTIHPSSLLYILTATAGLYTHYAYPVVLIAVNLAALLYFVRHSSLAIRHSPFATRHSLFTGWLLLQLIPLLLYLPWLPTAWRQLTTWPGNDFPPGLGVIWQTIATTLLLGLSWPFDSRSSLILILALLVAVPGLFYGLKISRLRPAESARGPALLLVYGWFLLPLLLTAAIFSPAFLKFLVVAAPALALLLALSAAELFLAASRRWLGVLLAGLLLAQLASTSVVSLAHYYTDPAFARDDYRAIAQFIRAVAGPGDAVILNAEGQQDVFGYYYPAGPAEPPVFPLPRQRPLDEAATLAELRGIAARAGKIYAVYWAQQQADPAGVIEGWLDAHTFKATDRWFGNVRLVSYASPAQNVALAPRADRFGDNLRLTGFGLAAARVVPGDIVQVVLAWQADDSPANLAVFLQLLNGANQVISQRDAPLTPANLADNRHGIFIEPGTPPGQYRLIAGLYNSQTGQRLPVAGNGDFVELAQIEVTPSAAPLPPEAFHMQTRLNAPLPGVSLLGYDFYKLGHRSEPDTPLHPGDAVELAAYWQRQPNSAAPENQVTVRLLAADGAPTPIEFTAPLTSADYPPGRWRPAEIGRGQYTFFLSNLPPGVYRLELTVQTKTALGEPFAVE